jgi:hypothetical protein
MSNNKKTWSLQRKKGRSWEERRSWEEAARNDPRMELEKRETAADLAAGWCCCGPMGSNTHPEESSCIGTCIRKNTSCSSCCCHSYGFSKQLETCCCCWVHLADGPGAAAGITSSNSSSSFCYNLLFLHLRRHPLKRLGHPAHCRSIHCLSHRTQLLRTQLSLSPLETPQVPPAALSNLQAPNLHTSTAAKLSQSQRETRHPKLQRTHSRALQNPCMLTPPQGA